MHIDLVCNIDLFREKGSFGAHRFWSWSEFPTNFNLSETGMFFIWRKRSVRFSDYIPWNCVSRVSIRHIFQPQSGTNDSGKALVIDINPRVLSLFKQWSLYVHTTSMWAHGSPFAFSAGTPHLNILRLEFPFDALTLDADKQRLISALHNYLPASVFTPEFNEVASADKASSYTQLWLDEMQSFRRARVADLSGGDLLQDGKYQIQGRIATGGQAKIYSAIDAETCTEVVLKEMVLPIQAGTDTRNRSFDNVRREAVTLASLEHPNIVRLIDHFVEDHRAYLVLQHIKGLSLRKLIQESGPQPPLFVHEVAVQMADVLGYLHSQSPPVIHRDVSPDNFMLEDGRLIKLLDFNVAQRLESNATQTVVGKHNYMAPEQFKGKPCPQSDLYSLGATLYFLLTAQDPQAITCSRPSAVTAVPEYLDDLIAGLTCLDVRERLSSSDDVKLKLGAAVTNL